MKNIRKSVFETNSSSTHSICIAKDVEVELPKKLDLEFGEFGWECDRLDSLYSKSSYLYTAVVNYGSPEELEKIFNFLAEEGIEVKFEEVTPSKTFFETGYIDHGGNLCEFIEDVTSDKSKLFSYLFSPFSFVLTGNDNDGLDVDINVNYPYYSYYKGN